MVPFALAAALLAGDTSEDWLDLARPWASLRLTFPNRRDRDWRALGSNELGWGRLLGVGPSGKRFTVTLANRHGTHPYAAASQGTPRQQALGLHSHCASCPHNFRHIPHQSGILDSMHAFAGGILGPIFLAVLVFIIVFSVGLAWRRGDCLKGRGPSSAYTGTALDWQSGKAVMCCCCSFS